MEIDRNEYDNLILTEFAFGCLKASLLNNAKRGYQGKSLIFDESALNEILSILIPDEYKAKIKELGGE